MNDPSFRITDTWDPNGERRRLTCEACGTTLHLDRHFLLTSPQSVINDSIDRFVGEHRNAHLGRGRFMTQMEEVLAEKKRPCALCRAEVETLWHRRIEGQPLDPNAPGICMTCLSLAFGDVLKDTLLKGQ